MAEQEEEARRENPYGRAADDASSTRTDRGMRASAGGVYVGDRPNSYGYHCQTGLLHADGGESYALGGAAPSGHATDDIYSLWFLVEEDCLAIAQNGVRIGTVCTDAFSEDQVWVPAVSLRGCGVSLLPPQLL
ncbi:hypothetical protein STCU_10933 [Strigomonas culicis]|uniref:Uncharacterized protein n=1 Tax=Strigomonas culicis TaxID=28005 RepID=S9V231_9TRYP|nr:hypothetical protein STCU_10933 [Strigomonas culicis]|eukprot:EPY16885.1 hypothetical protein STCU_10933 [Strigomonas culicis]